MKVYQKLSLYLLAGILIFSLPGGGNYLQGIETGNDSDGLKHAYFHKLIGPLKTAVMIYRTDSRLTELNIRQYYRDKNNRVRSLRGQPPISSPIIPFNLPPRTTSNKRKMVGSGTLSYTASSSLPATRPVIIDALINEEIQEEWGNPPYDVIDCNIEIAGGVNLLSGFNIKIRALSEFEGKIIVSAEVASPEIEKIAGLNQVLQISPVLKKIINNNLAADAIRASRIRLKSGNNYTKGYTGEGVVVGIIDSGIDWTHEDFIDPDTGESRIRYIWDTEVTTNGRTPADIFGGVLSGLDFGTVWTKAEIDGGACTSVDTNGHGTHVTGSAAGNGYATGNYTGIAPNADIIFVKGLRNEGILFIYEVSAQLGMPCSINMSYGPGDPINYIAYWPQPWPADATDIDAQEIAGWNATYGGGHIPVKSAGNEGHWDTYTDLTSGSYPYKNGSYHVEGHLTGGAEAHIQTVVDYSGYWPFYLTGINSIYFPILTYGYWSDQPIQITFTSPDGRVIGPVLHGNDGTSYPPSGPEQLDFYMDNPQASNGNYYGSLELLSTLSPYYPTLGNWTISVEAIGGGPVNYDIWCGDIYSYAWYGDKASYFTGNYTHANYIIDEGASPYEISVGSFTTRDGWAGLDGGSWTYAMKPQIGQISPFSSPGPSRDRRTKPDISAPGEIIISTASAFAGWSNSNLDPDGRHGQMSGTSMAAPMTTGATALILQKYPESTIKEVKRRLTYWAVNDNKTRDIGKNGFGEGKLNVLPLNDPGVAVLTQNKTEVILDNADRAVEFDGSASYDPEGFPISYVWNIEEKPEGSNPVFTVNNDKATLDVDPLVEGFYVVSLLINDSVVNGGKAFSERIEAKFYPVLPPAGVTLGRIANDLIFTEEYVNRISWTENPGNMVELTAHRIYRKVKGNGDETYSLVAELPVSSTGYDDRGLTKDQYFTYKITSVSVAGKESDPVVVSN